MFTCNVTNSNIVLLFIVLFLVMERTVARCMLMTECIGEVHCCGIVVVTCQKIKLYLNVHPVLITDIAN